MALKSVPQKGWTMDSLMHASMQLDPSFNEETVKTIFHRGPVEIVEFFVKKKCTYVATAMREAREDERDAAETMHPLKAALLLHGHYLMPFSNHWANAVAILCEPQQIVPTFGMLVEVAEHLHSVATPDKAPSHTSTSSSSTSPLNESVDPFVDRSLLALLYIVTDLYVMGKVGEGSSTQSSWPSSSSSEDRVDEVDEVADVESERGQQRQHERREPLEDAEMVAFISSSVDLYLAVKAKVPANIAPLFGREERR